MGLQAISCRKKEREIEGPWKTEIAFSPGLIGRNKKPRDSRRGGF